MAIKVSNTTVIDDSRNLSNITNATNTNTASAFVVRDASGNFSAGTITANLSGTATQVSNTLTIGTGLTGSNFNGSAASTLAVSYGTTAGTACQGNDSRLSNARQATNTATQLLRLGVGTAASGTTGEIRATNNVTAYYSDPRLKDFEGTIDNALYKVLQINGYYFRENETAKSLGYNNDRRQVGVSSQEVEAVLPEVVTDAPINSNFEGADYKTVYYEKLVPLLIEAIKEQQKQIEELKTKIG